MNAMNDSSDAELQRIESRLVARETRLRQGLDGARMQLHDAMQPSRWVAPAAGVVGTLVVWKLLRRKRARAAAPVAVQHAPVGVFGQLVSLLVTAAPILVHMIDRKLEARAEATAERRGRAQGRAAERGFESRRTV